MNALRFFVGGVILLALIGCAAENPAVPQGGPTPTLSSAFNRDVPPGAPAANDPAGQPTIASLFRGETVAPTKIAVAPTATITPPRVISVPATPSSSLTEKIIFDDALDPNWSLDNSKEVRLDPRNATRAKNGKTALAVTPLADFGTLYFTVRQDAKENYPRATTWGVSLWINGGDNSIAPDDLALTVIGSNSSKFWIANDKSVVVDKKIFFSETRLYYLGVTRQIPPNIWVELVLRLDKLPYDPDYKYMTGIYLKNDPAFKKIYFVDRVALLLNK
jgi:hypothetical protein